MNLYSLHPIPPHNTSDKGGQTGFRPPLFFPLPTLLYIKTEPASQVRSESESESENQSRESQNRRLDSTMLRIDVSDSHNRFCTPLNVVKEII